MNALSPIADRFVLPADAKTDLLINCQSYVRTHGDALADAAGFAAGLPGARLAVRLCDDIAKAKRWQGGFAERLDRLRGLLLLEHLDDPDTVYPIPVEILEPCDDWAIACCQQVERLDDLIAQSAAFTATVGYRQFPTV